MQESPGDRSEFRAGAGIDEEIGSVMFFGISVRFRQARLPIPAGPEAMKLEIVKLRQAGWSDRTIASLLHCHTKTVRKWWRRFQQSQQQPTQMQPLLWWEELSRAPY